MATPFGAVYSKELRLWLRDPRRARFTRIALWTGLFTGLLPLLGGSRLLLPWSGVITVLFAGALSANLYGLDAGALWLTMVTPGMERTDVRARQAAWLTLVLPITVVLTAAMAFVSVPSYLWPWVLAVLPATTGAAAGLIPLVSLLGPAPFPDRPGGNPLDGFSDESGDQVRLQTLIVLVAELLAAAPAAAIVLTGRLLHSPMLPWLGLPAGLVSGVFFAWLLGRLAYGRLRSQGPEILDILRKGPQRDPVAVRAGHDDTVPVPARQDLPGGIAAETGVLVSIGHPVTDPSGHRRARARQRAREGTQLVPGPAFLATRSSADLDRLHPGRPRDDQRRGGAGVDNQAQAAPCGDRREDEPGQSCRVARAAWPPDRVQIVGQ